MERYWAIKQLYDDMPVVLAGLMSFFIGALCAYSVVLRGRKGALLDVPCHRSSHAVAIPRGGGVGIVVAFTITGIVFTNQYAFIATAFLVGLLGFIDDAVDVSTYIRLIFQIVLGCAMLLGSGFVIHSVRDGLLFVFFLIFIVATANFYNFMDGIDGIAGLCGIVAFGLLACWTVIFEGYRDVVIIVYAVAFACMGFLVFNFPRARVFMGDVGSVFLGFVFAGLVVKIAHTPEEFLCVVLFMYPFYSDTLLTLYFRWRRGENIIHAHRSHLYQLLVNELSIPHWKVSTVYAVVQLIAGLTSLAVYRRGVWVQALVAAVLVCAFLVTYNKICKGVEIFHGHD
ncbi:MAG: glycosyltransferase family 4 protein [Nitrospirae bacterium]|nr:glycosyltransferase family 4 protein [Nitrospirota bacterium]